MLARFSRLKRPFFAAVSLVAAGYGSCCLGGEVAGQGSRVAIVSDEATADLAALLATELSGRPGIELVERDELAKAGDELRVQKLTDADATVLGRAVGADGVLFLRKDEDGVKARFTAAGLGYALFDDRFTALQDLPHFAQTMADRVANYAPKLKLKPEEAIPISVLNLRADQVSPAAVEVERKLSLLLESRLAAVRSYVIVERRHASAIRFENLLTDAKEAPIPGVARVDGSLSLPAGGKGEMAVRLRLQRAGQEPVMLDFRGSVESLSALAGEMAAALGKKLGTSTDLPAWDARQEAREYLREGVWASRNNANEAALEALDSAELLGQNPADVMVARIPVQCAVAVGSSRIIFTEETTAADPSPSARVEAMRRAFEEEVRYEQIDGAAKLQDYQPPPSTLAHADIRRGMIARAAASLLGMLDATKSPHAKPVREAFREFQGYDPLKGKLPEDAMNSIRYADALSDSLEEEKAYYRIFLEASPSSPGWRFLQDVISYESFGARFLPDRGERHAAYLQFLRSLVEGPGKLTALQNIAGALPRGPVRDEACEEYFQALTEKRDALAAEGNLIPFLIGAFDLERLRGRKEADARLIALERFVLQHANEIHGLLNQTWRPELFPAAEAPGLWEDFLALEGRAPDPYRAAQSMRQNYLSRFPPSGPAGALVVNRFWIPPDAPDKPSFATSPVTPAADGVWVAANFYGAEDWNSAVYHVALVDGPPGTFRTEVFPRPNFNAYSLALGSNGHLYVLGNEGKKLREPRLAQLSPATGVWETKVAPAATRIFAAGGSLYFALTGFGLTEMEGGVVRMDEKTGAQTILASSRRRPGFNQFDDRESYSVKTIFAGPGGQPCASIGFGEVYAMSEDPGDWPLVIPSGSLYSSVTSGSRTLLYGRSSARDNPKDVAFLVDTTKPFPELWLGASAPLLGTKTSGKAQPMPPQPDWAQKPRWADASSGDETKSSYGFRGDDLFAYVIHRQTQEKELLWYRSGKTDPVRIPLSFVKSDEAAAALKAMENKGSGPAKMQSPVPPSPPDMYCAPQGLCFLARNEGFWFLPFSDIDAFLKATR